MSQVFPVAFSHSRQPLCVPHVLAEWSKRTPDVFTILAPERPPLTYNHLQRHMDDVLQTLRAMGLGRYDGIALLLPNGGGGDSPLPAMHCAVGVHCQQAR